jgi:copper chaperone CopZ
MTSEFTARITFTSPRIHGSDDVDRLEDELSDPEGVRDVDVDTTAHTVTIAFDPTVISATGLQGKVEELGYKIDSKSEQEQLPL